MRKILGVGSMAVLIAACSAGAQPSGGESAEQGSNQTQRNFQVGAFERVSLEGSHDVVVTVGGAPSVRAEGDAAAIERLDIRVENGQLKIATQRGNWSWRRQRGRVTVFVTAPSLNGAAIGGSGDMRIDRVESPRFAASIAGSGNLDIAALRTQRADLSIAGSGDVAIQASESVDASILGSGDINVRGSARCSVSKMGSGDVHCGG